jgi:hypothetical protein
MTTLSQPAVLALIELEHGASFNCMHTISRELIEGGFAFDGWDKLEITEMGRRAARTFRSFKASDPNISNMGDLNEPMFTTPLDSHGVTPFKLLPVAPQPPPQPQPDPQPPSGLPWSRDRAMRAAGIANGAQEPWVASAWVQAFMDAYEAIE